LHNKQYRCIFLLVRGTLFLLQSDSRNTETSLRNHGSRTRHTAHYKQSEIEMSRTTAGQKQQYMRRMSRARLLATGIVIAQLLWAFTMLVGAVLKIVDSGVHSYLRHFTNWSWTLQLLFYFATSPAPLLVVNDSTKSLGAQFVRAVVALTFVPLVGIVFVVAGVVMVLLGTRSQFLVVLFREHSPSFVMLGNDVYHFVPIIALLGYGLVNWHFILHSINWLLNRSGRWALALYLAYGGPAISLLWYITFFDPRVVYQTSIGFVPGALFTVIMLTLFVFAPVASAIFVFDLGRWPVDSNWLAQRYPLTLGTFVFFDADDAPQHMAAAESVRGGERMEAPRVHRMDRVSDVETDAYGALPGSSYAVSIAKHQ